MSKVKYNTPVLNGSAYDTDALRTIGIHEGGHARRLDHSPDTIDFMSNINPYLWTTIQGHSHADYHVHFGCPSGHSCK